MAKNSLRIWEKIIVALHKDGEGYKKFAKTLKLSCSTVAKTIQRFNRTSSTQCQHCCKGWRGGGSACQCSDYTPHTASNWSVWLSFQKEASFKDNAQARKQFAEDKQTKDMDYWNHVLWSDETKINLFGSDGVKRVRQQSGDEYKDKCVLPTVKHGGGSVIVWGCTSAAGTGELQFIEGTMIANMYCDILKQSMIPSLRRLGHRAVFQHDNDHCLAKEAEGKGGGLAKHVSRPKPYWASVGHPQTKGGGAQGL